jgi:hypothetical protein
MSRRAPAPVDVVRQHAVLLRCNALIITMPEPQGKLHSPCDLFRHHLALCRRGDDCVATDKARPLFFFLRLAVGQTEEGVVDCVSRS